MSANPAEPYLDAITLAYQSLEAPEYSFVKRAHKKRPYGPVIKRIRDYAAVEDVMDTEDDVCFSYFLKGRAALWKMDLSMVAPFAIFVRLKQSVSEEDFLHFQKIEVTDFERKILDILRSNRIKCLTPAELVIPVPLTLYNTPKGQVTLYQAMFSDQPSPPWQG
jgi:hypothetical protein